LRAARRDLFQHAIERLHAAIENLHRMPHPVIVGQGGGGVRLSSLCMRPRRRRDDAYFTSAYRTSHNADGRTWTLPRIVGLRKAMENHSPFRALRRSRSTPDRIVNKSRASAALDAAVNAIVESLVDVRSAALRNAKRLLRESQGRSLSSSCRWRP